MAMGPREGRVLHAMSIDDAYEVQRVLSSGSGGRTEVVTIDGFGPYLRKKIPSPLVDRRVWAALSECVGLRLPHVVATYETPDEFVVVCDFVPGDTLYEVVSAQGRLPVSEAVRIALEVCEAVEELHRRGIAHCDISPRNVLLAPMERISSIWASRGLLEPSPLRRLRTLEPTGLRLPEQYGFAPVDERTDVYAAARLLGFMLTGLEPGDAYRVALVDESVVPTPLRAVIERGSAFEPSARFQTIRDFACAGARKRERCFPRTVPLRRESLPARLRTHSGQSGTRAITAVAPPRPRASAFLLRNDEPRLSRPPGIAAILIVLAVAIGYAALSDVLAEVGAGRDGGSVHQARDDHASSSDALPVDGEAPEAADRSSSDGLPPAGFSEEEMVFSKEDLVVAESSWRMSNGCISYVVALRNESKDMAVDYPAFNIVGRDSEGKIVSSEEQVLPRLNPGETMYFASIAGTGTVTPHSVDFLPIAPDDYQVHRAQSESAVFRVADVSATTDALGGRFRWRSSWEGGERDEDAAVTLS